jgi:hypothetical protein
MYEPNLCQESKGKPCDCERAHSLAEITYHPLLFRTRFCPKGPDCAVRPRCPDAHSPSDLRSDLSSRYLHILNNTSK